MRPSDWIFRRTRLTIWQSCMAKTPACGRSVNATLRVLSILFVKGCNFRLRGGLITLMHLEMLCLLWVTVFCCFCFIRELCILILVHLSVTFPSKLQIKVFPVHTYFEVCYLLPKVWFSWIWLNLYSYSAIACPIAQNYSRCRERTAV